MSTGREKAPLLVNDDIDGGDAVSQRVGPVEGARFWVLFWYSYIAALQSLLWLTYSSVPDHSKKFLDTNTSTLYWFLNEGPIAYCIAVPFVVRLLDSKSGLQRSVRAGATLCFLGAIIRCIPFLAESKNTGIGHDFGIGLVHVAQSLNAAAAPFVVASVSHLSIIWFSESGRNTATAVANVASALGRAIGFFLGPAIVHHANDLKMLLLIEVGLAAVSLVAVWVYYPLQPLHPPSTAAATLQYGTSGRGTFKDITDAFKKPSFIPVVIAGGLSMGVYGMWSGVLSSVVPSAWGDTTAGDFGLANTLAGIIAGVVAGTATDLKPLRKHLKLVMIGTLALACCFFAIFALSLPPLSIHGLESLANHKSGLLVICTAAGFFRGMSDPLFFELSAEVVFPQSAGTAGSILTFWYHITLVMSLSLPDKVLQNWALIGMGGVIVVCIILLSMSKIRYVRR